MITPGVGAGAACPDAGGSQALCPSGGSNRVRALTGTVYQGSLLHGDCMCFRSRCTTVQLATCTMSLSLVSRSRSFVCIQACLCPWRPTMLTQTCCCKAVPNLRPRVDRRETAPGGVLTVHSVRPGGRAPAAHPYGKVCVFCGAAPPSACIKERNVVTRV